MGSRTRSGARVYIIARPVFDIRVQAKVDSPEDLYEDLDIGILRGPASSTTGSALRLGIRGVFARCCVVLVVISSGEESARRASRPARRKLP